MSSETDKRWKGRKIDWLEIADMDNSSYELKPLSQQHVAILLMLLDYQKWTTRWENLGLTKGELESYIGDIEYRLMLNDGGWTVTPEEFYDANKRAIYDAINDVAKQIVSGRTTNISIDEDGIVTNPIDEIGDSVVEDDPDTPSIDESKASNMGGAIAVSQALEKLFDMLDTKYGGVNGSPLITEGQMVDVVGSYFPSDSILMGVGVAEYYNWRLAQPALNFNVSSTFSRYMYCKGSDKDAFNRYLIDLSGYAESRRIVYAALVEALLPEFWDEYFAYGASVPSSDYKAASCEPIPFESFTLAMSGAGTSIQYTTNGVWKAGHRYLIKVSQTYTDTDNLTLLGDGMYRVDTSSGIKTFNSLVFNFSGSVSAPAQSQVPYESSHIYEFTVEKAVGSGDAAGIISKSEAVMVQPNRTGNLLIEVTDLGEFAL